MDLSIRVHCPLPLRDHRQPDSRRWTVEVSSSICAAAGLMSSSWMEGLVLMLLYLIIAVSFWYYPVGRLLVATCCT
jgi:hypothetical protein